MTITITRVNSLYSASKKSSQTVPGLWNRGPLKVRDDTKLISNESNSSSRAASCPCVSGSSVVLGRHTSWTA